MKLKLKQFLSKLINTPLVVETGTEGIWYYRKWSDGTAECWGTYSKTFAPTTAWGSVKYVSEGYISFPTNLFNTIPIVSAFLFKNGTAGIPIIAGDDYTKDSMRFFIVELNTTNFSYTPTVSLYAIGRWAEVDPTSSSWTITNLSQNQMTKAEIQTLIEGSGNEFKELDAAEDVWIPPDLT